MAGNLRVERLGAVTRLTLNRPDAMNAMSRAMLEALEVAMVEASRDDAVRVLVITGEGKAFCAGADLKAFQGGLQVADGERDFLRLAADAIGAVAACPKPVIAAINGVALAGGLELAMAADIIVAADTAKMGDGHANYGMFPGAGGAAVLPRLLPRGVALYLLFTGRLLSAADLQRLGFVAEIHPRADLPQAALELAQTIAERSPVALRGVKAVARATLGRSEAEALQHEQVVMRQHIASWDMAEGLQAFAEKRAPQFRGN